MLISLIVENFRSFDSQQEFSMVASTRQTSFPDHLVEVPGTTEKLVPLAAIYGANGAGKSNLVRALAWLHELVTTRTLRAMPFIFAPANRPTRIEVRFLSGGDVLAYGITQNQKEIETEWLSVVMPSGKEKVVFERKTTDGRATLEFGGEIGGDKEKLAAFGVLGVKGSEPLIRRLVDELSETELPPAVRRAKSWFAKLLVLVPDSEFIRLAERVSSDTPFRDYATALVRRMDASLQAVTLKVTSHKLELLPQDVRSKVREAPRGESVHLGGISVQQVDEENVNVRDVGIEHSGPDSARTVLPIFDESDGTQRLVHLAPLAFDATEDIVVVVDELDRSLHALLVREFVREFLRRARGHSSQLIFTTHETHVLDQDLVRRDEVWFVEKNEHGASELFSLDDFGVRNDLRLDRSYLQGRFGAIPPLGT